MEIPITGISLDTFRMIEKSPDTMYFMVGKFKKASCLRNELIYVFNAF